MKGKPETVFAVAPDEADDGLVEPVTPGPGTAVPASPAPGAERLEQQAARWASATLAARVLATLAMLVSVPLLLRALGEAGFAAWAVLHGSASLLGLCEFGATPTLVRYLATPIRDGDRARVDTVLSSAFLPLVPVVAAVVALAWPLAVPLAGWLRLPDTPWLDAVAMLRLTLTAVGVQTLLGVLLAPAQAAQRFVLAAALAAGSTVSATAVAVGVALASERLDLALVAFLATRLLSLAAAIACVRVRVCAYSLRPRLVRRPVARQLFRHGGMLQVSQLCEFVNAQFDKLIIPGFVSLAAVAPYEAACRALFGVRGFPVAAVSVLLPAAAHRHDRGDDLSALYVRASRVAALGVALCLLAPWAVAPLLFRAWVGDAGDAAATLFALLLPGIAMNVYTAPVSTVLQASAGAGLQAAVSAGALALNAALSLLLVGRFGVAGAAAGTAVSMVATSLGYLWLFHRRLGVPLVTTLGSSLRPLLPLLPLLAAMWWGSRELLVCFGHDRALLGVAALALGLVFLPLAIVAVTRWGGLDGRERSALASLAAMFSRRRRADGRPARIDQG
ncbi:MAG: lipopolysaccharide biosynthesis protein [Planctomycetota bacterium]